MKENVIKKEVTILGISAMDFKTQDGSKICGYKVYYMRDLEDSEKNDNYFGKKVEDVYLAKEDISDKLKYKNKVYPTKGVIEFEIVALNKKPKPLNIIL